MLPHGVHHRITRDYGKTANEKVNELVEGLVIAVITVVGFDRIDDWLASRVRCRFGHSGLLQLDTRGQPVAWLYDQPCDNVCFNPCFGVAGRRSDYRCREHCPILFHEGSVCAPQCSACNSRSSTRTDHVDFGDHRQFPSALVHHGHDGSLHGADGTERSADGHALDRRRFPGDALAGHDCNALHVDGRPRRRV